MIDPELGRFLRCPEDKSPLATADAKILERANALVATGRLKNRGGQAVSERLVAALVRADGKVLYPVRDGIPLLLADEGIPLGE